LTTIVIRNADWVVAWHEGAGRHVYRRDLDIAFSGGTIVFVGRNYRGAADEVVDGKDRLVLPGLIDIHSHPSTSRSIVACARSTACAACT
jgi:5-methylthioadenosine/S-adenosylhomocysteine deaminase